MSALEWDKELWKREAFDSIKQSLNFARDYRIAGNYDNATEEHLVVIYGPTQIGKTTLILSMLGLKDDKDDDKFKEVYDTLRAEQKQGESSTAAAIVYSKSPRENEYEFGELRYGSHGAAGQVEYMDSKMLISRLKDIRKKAESQALDTNTILSIKIPASYFEKDAGSDNISIIDLPGDKSRLGEKEYADRLFKKYLPIASVCIVACKANEIQSLNTLELPNGIAWKEMAHRFVLAVTYAYSRDNIRSELKLNPTWTADEIRETVQKRFVTDIRQDSILGKLNQLEIYPLEIGNSLNASFDNVQLKDKVKECQRKTFKLLREAIARRNGERLQAAIADLRSLIRANSNHSKQEVEESIRSYEKEIERIQGQIKDRETFSKGYDIARSQQERAKLNNHGMIDQFNALANNTMECSYEEAWKQFYDWLVKNKELNHFGKCVKLMNNHRFDIYRNLQNYILQHADAFFKKLLKLDSKADREQFDKTVLEAFPEDGGIFKITDTKNDGWQMYMTVEELKEFYFRILDSLKNKLQKSVEPSKNFYTKANQECDKIIAGYKASKKAAEKECEQLREKIDQYKAECDRLNKEKNNISKLVRKDEDILNDYLSIVEATYKKHRQTLVDRANGKNISREERLKYILLIGVLDKDYQKIVGGNSNG